MDEGSSAAEGGAGVERGPLTTDRRLAHGAHGLAVPVLAAAIALTASAASANPLTDCFERIAVAARHMPHHHAAAPHRLVHRARHLGPRPRVRHVAAPGRTVAYAHRTHYILRPRACGTHEALMTPLAGVAAPEAPELLLAELVGPAPAAVDVADTAPVAGLPIADIFTPGFSFPGGPATTPGGGFVFPGGGPGGGPGQPPGTPPVTPPGVTPAGPGPVIVPPVEGPPPVVIPVVTPVGPGIFPPVVPVVDITPPPPGGPPGVPPLPGGPPVIPEPATWAMFVVGVFGLGAALRRRRASP
jgi:hypothetical protein